MPGLKFPSSADRRPLQALQEKLYPRQIYGSSETTCHYIADVCNGRLRNSPEFRRYIDCILEDENIAIFARAQRFSTGHFEHIFRLLASAGMNRWQGGQHLALEALGDYHALLYIFACIKRKKPAADMADTLEAYLSGEIKTHHLIKTLGADASGNA